MIKIIVAGFKGRMGSTATQMVLETADFELVGVYDPHEAQETVSFNDETAIPVFQRLEEVLAVKPDVWIDFTVPEAAYPNTRFALEHGMAPVVGTTGFTEEQINELTNLSREKAIGGLIAPNFAIGAVLMMQFAQKAAQYLPDVEIIELHHDNKLDAPSGTAIKTAEMIQEVRPAKKQGNPQEVESIPGARGADFEGLRIHSVHLPGLVAHQQVQFGSVGEGLTIRHDSYDRRSFMTGVALACRQVVQRTELLYGLEQML